MMQSLQEHNPLTITGIGRYPYAGYYLEFYSYMSHLSSTDENGYPIAYGLIPTTPIDLSPLDVSKLRFTNMSAPEKEYDLIVDWYTLLAKEKKSQSGDEWFQQQVNEIAATDSKKGAIKVPEQYKTLTKGVTIPEGCDITVYNDLEMAQGFNDDFVFRIEKDASLRFSYPFSFTPYIDYQGTVFENNGGTFYSEKGCKYGEFPQQTKNGYIIHSVGGRNVFEDANIITSKPLLKATGATKSTLEITEGYYQYKYNEASFVSGNVDMTMNGGEMVSNCKFFLEPTTFTMYDGYVIGNEQLVSATLTNYIGGSIAGASTILSDNGVIGDKMDFSHHQTIWFWSGVARVSGKSYLPEVINYNDGTIHTLLLTSAIEYEINLAGCWSCFLGQKGCLMKGDGEYVMTMEDFKKLTFRDMPDDMEAYFDSSDNSVKLKKITNSGDDLQDFLDSLGKDDRGTEEDPVPVTPGPGGLDIDDDLNIGDDLQLFIDGGGNGNGDGSDDKGFVRLKGGNIIIKPGCSVRFRDIYLDGCDGTNYIEVGGTLIIDINVYIRLFKEWPVRVLPGGKVIVEGGDFSESNGGISNDGGTVEIIKIIYKPQDKNNPAIDNKKGTVIIHDGDFDCHGDHGCVYNRDGGEMTFHGGSFSGGVYNYGTMYIHNGHFRPGKGNGGVFNYGIRFIVYGGVFDDEDNYPGLDTDTESTVCGCAVITRIHLRDKGVIRFTSPLEVLIRIHVYIENNGRYVLVGGDGKYRFTLDDFKKIEWILPDGYVVTYNEEDGTADMSDTSGVIEIMDSSEISDEDVIYDLGGFVVGKWMDRESLAPGVYIVKNKKMYIGR